MVGTYKVKVRFPCLALAHVSHVFTEREPWALKQSTRFDVLALPAHSLPPAVGVPLALASPSEQLAAPSGAESQRVHSFICSGFKSTSGPCASKPARARIFPTRNPHPAPRFRNLWYLFSFGAPPPLFPKRPSLWFSYTKRAGGWEIDVFEPARCRNICCYCCF